MLTIKHAILLNTLCVGILAAQVPPTLTKSFNPSTVLVGGITTVTLTLTNPNPSATLTNINYTDTLPLATFQFQSFSGVTNCSVASFVNATGVLTVDQASLAPLASCAVAFTVKTLVPGTIVNTTSQVTSSAGLGAAASATLVVGSMIRDTAFQTRYFANLTLGESYINITNTGANGAPLLGPGFGGAVGNICVNVYAFSPDEQLVSCCSCLVTPNALVNLGVTHDLIANTLTGVIPTSLVVKMIATLAGANGGGSSCVNSAATSTAANIVPGMLAWGTTIHNAPAAAPGYRVTETSFSPATLSAGELASITGRCASIIGNGSGFGICRSCQAGALGASRTF